MAMKNESKSVVDKIGLSSFSEGYSERSEFLVATLIAVPPDGGYGWIILCASFFNNFLIGFYYAFPLVLSNISQNHAPLTFHELAYSMGLAGFSFNIAGKLLIFYFGKNYFLSEKGCLIENTIRKA